MAQRGVVVLRQRLARVQGRIALAGIALAKDDGGSDTGSVTVDDVHIPAALTRRRRPKRPPASQGVVSVATMQKRMARLHGALVLAHLAADGTLTKAGLKGWLGGLFDEAKHPRGPHGKFAAGIGHDLFHNGQAQRGSLHGVPFAPWHDAPSTVDGWS